MTVADLVLGGPVLLEAIAPDGRIVHRLTLEHGADPAVVLADLGLRLDGVLGARREGEPLVVSVAVRVADVRSRSDRAPSPEPQRRPVDLVIGADESPVRVQRAGAYACVVSEWGLLATQYFGSGAWGLPGGGIDPGEDPVAAVVRESREESGQDVVVEKVLHLECDHWIGRAPAGYIEDFHAVRLIYAATCPLPTDPVVQEIDGTTMAARWVPTAQLATLEWSPAARRQLQRLALIDGSCAP